MTQEPLTFRYFFSGHLSCWAGAILLFCLTFWLFYLHAVSPPWGKFQGDLRTHLAIMQAFIRGKQTIPHPGFHYAILLFAGATGISLKLAAAFVLALATTASYIIVYTMLMRCLSMFYSSSSLAGLALVCAMVSAIYAPFFSRNIYLGQGTPNPWHNPTWIMMQPFALLSFFWTERSFLCATERRRAALTLALLGSGSLVLATFCKPNFTLAFIPALGIYYLVRCRPIHPWRIQFILLGVIIIPSFILLGWQYVNWYGSTSSQAGTIIFAPFEVWRTVTPSITISVFLALAFPLATALLRPKAFTEQPGFLLAWFLMGIAFLQYALLAESGKWKANGNWSWGYLIALKIVFIYSVVVLLRRQTGELPDRRFLRWLPWGIVSLHLGSGLLYFWRLLSGRGFL